MEYSRFLQELRKGVIRPAYFFMGKEDFLADAGVQELTERLLTRDERDFNLSVIYGKEPEALPQALATPPMFAARRVTIVKQAGELKDAMLDTVIGYLKNPPADGCLILWGGDVDKRKTFYKKIEPVIEPVNCGKPKSAELQSWLTVYVSKYGKKLDKDATQRLLAINWPSVRDLATEIDRLTLLIGERELISLKDIEELGGGSFAFEIWKLNDALCEGNLSAAMLAADNLLAWGTRPNQIVGSLYKTFSQLWFIRWHIEHKKLGDAKQSLDVKDFVFEKLTRQAGSFSLEGIENALVRILEAELSIKRGERNDVIETSMVISGVAQALKTKRIARGAA